MSNYTRNKVPKGSYGAYFDGSIKQPLLEVQMEGGDQKDAGNDENEIQVEKPKKDDRFGKNTNFGCVYKIKRSMGWTVSRENRTIFLQGKTEPRSFPTNKLNNQKYNIISFIPVLLYNEFKFFFNMFFLLIALSQFIPFLKVGLIITYIAPLVFVLTITMFKEALDDIKRLYRDKELNSTPYEAITSKNPREFVPIQAKDIKVGQIIKVKHN